MSIADEIGDALKESEGILENVFTHSENEYPCNASSFERMQTWEESIGGGMVEYNLRLVVRLAVITGTAIAENDTVIHRGNHARVNKIIDDPSGTFMRILCVYEKSP